MTTSPPSDSTAETIKKWVQSKRVRNGETLQWAVRVCGIEVARRCTLAKAESDVAILRAGLACLDTTARLAAAEESLRELLGVARHYTADEMASEKHEKIMVKASLILGE